MIEEKEGIEIWWASIYDWETKMKGYSTEQMVEVFAKIVTKLCESAGYTYLEGMSKVNKELVREANRRPGRVYPVIIEQLQLIFEREGRM